MKQEVYNISVPSIVRPSNNVKNGIKKYKKRMGRWVINEEWKYLKDLPNAKVNKVAEYEIDDNPE